MNKSRLVFWFRSILAVMVIFSFVLLGAMGAEAASTIGTNMTTTGTFTITPATDSATSVRFQNTAGTNIFIVNSTSRWVGVGAAPQTTFEVQGTSSASYFLTGNTIQVGGFASVAYSRFGTNATTGSFLADTNDLLISGNLEVDLKSLFDSPVEIQGTASASYFLTGNTIQVGGFASVAYSRFGTTAATRTASGLSNPIDTTNDLLINGSLEVDGQGFFDGTASVTGDFEAVGRASASTGFVTGSFVVAHNVASSSTAYLAEFGGGSGTATVSILFGSNSASSKGTCFQMKNDVGTWVYARVFGTTWTVNNTKCHP